MTIFLFDFDNENTFNEVASYRDFDIGQSSVYEQYTIPDVTAKYVAVAFLENTEPKILELNIYTH
jgi:hypothetical protein